MIKPHDGPITGFAVAESIIEARNGDTFLAESMMHCLMHIADPQLDDSVDNLIDSFITAIVEQEERDRVEKRERTTRRVRQLQFRPYGVG